MKRSFLAILSNSIATLSCVAMETELTNLRTNLHAKSNSSYFSEVDVMEEKSAQSAKSTRGSKLFKKFRDSFSESGTKERNKRLSAENLVIGDKSTQTDTHKEKSKRQSLKRVSSQKITVTNNNGTSITNYQPIKGIASQENVKKFIKEKEKNLKNLQATSLKLLESHLNKENATHYIIDSFTAPYLDNTGKSSAQDVIKAWQEMYSVNWLIQILTNRIASLESYRGTQTYEALSQLLRAAIVNNKQHIDLNKNLDKDVYFDYLFEGLRTWINNIITDEDLNQYETNIDNNSAPIKISIGMLEAHRKLTAIFGTEYQSTYQLFNTLNEPKEEQKTQLQNDNPIN